jgi:hypothetical protein
MKTKSGVMSVIFAVLITVMSAGVAQAAVMPVLQELQTINGLSSPTQVAISADKRIFVVEGDKNRIRIFKRNGSASGSLYIQKPSSVAVSPSGNIYVGSREDFSVSIYNAGGEKIGQLGAGANEFINPYFIYFDTAGSTVYVVDKNAGVIKRYEEGGAALDQTINDTGNLPEAMTIFNNELYVLDSPPAPDANGKYYSSSRIQVFDMAGNAVRSFGSWGNDVGQFKNPAGITHDNQGRIYVADGSISVLCFDGKTGAYLDMLYPLCSPMGVAMTADNMLGVSELGSRSVKIFGADSFSFMGVDPGSLTFMGAEGMPDPVPQQITITNAGTAQLSYVATKKAAWMSIQNAAGVVARKGQSGVIVSVNGSGLVAPGVYQDVITITDDSGAVESIQVRFEMKTSPKMTVRAPRTGLHYVYTAGGADPLPQTIAVTVSGDSDGTAQWHATISGADWLSIFPSAASGNGTTVSNVIAKPAGQSAGIYQGTIVVSSSVISGTPIIIPVTLHVRDADVVPVPMHKNIIVSPGMMGEGYAKIGIFDSKGIRQFEFSPFRLKVKKGYHVAAGDVDGDGVEDIIVGMGDGISLPARIAVFDRNGRKIAGTDKIALPTKYGAMVAAADLDGDGKAEVIVGSGRGPMNAAQVKVLTYLNGELKETGIDMMPFDTYYGINVAAGDIDGDGVDELVVAPGPDPEAGATIKVFKIDASGDTGLWTASEVIDPFIAFAGKCGANVAVGDIDGDGLAEIIASTGTCMRRTVNLIAAFEGTGKPAGLRIPDTLSGGGMVVAAGDLDKDGDADLVAAPVKSVNEGEFIRILYSGDGSHNSTFTAYSGTTLGANVAVGELGWGAE